MTKKVRHLYIGERDILEWTQNEGKDILSFNLGGYSYDPSISSPASPVFTRTQA